MSSPLEPFLPSYDAEEHFEVRVEAPAARTFALAIAFDLQSPRPVRAIFRLREVLLRSTPVVRPASQGLIADLRAIGWGELVSKPGELYIGGAYCQPWLADVHFRPLTAPSFLAFQEPGYVKIAWTIQAIPQTDTSCVLRTETRAAATDSATRQRFKRYWRWARLGILPIRWVLLPAIRRQAEADNRS
jgi:hypothetical protein